MNLLQYLGWRFPQVGPYDDRKLKYDLNEKVMARLDELIKQNQALTTAVQEAESKLEELEDRIQVLETT